jgi:hypothetical protein
VAQRQVDHYEVLGIPRTADAAAIRAAYLTLVKRYHPDVAGDEGSDEMMAALNEAHDVLRDPAARAAYDGGSYAAPSRPTSPDDGQLYVDVVLEKIDTGRARRKLATLNQEFVRMEQQGWHVEFLHDHLVCTRDQFAPPKDALFAISIIGALLAVVVLGGQFLQPEQVKVLVVVIAFGGIVSYLRDREKRGKAKPRRVTISIDPEGNPLVTAQPV